MDKNEPTILQAIILSDSVIREAGTNKLSLIGTFHQWNFPSFPALSPSFWITSVVGNLRHGGEELNLTVRIEEPNSGLVVFNNGAKVQLLDGPIPRGAVIEIPFPCPGGATFPYPGRYKINVLANGEPIAERSFEVTSMSLNPKIT